MESLTKTREVSRHSCTCSGLVVSCRSLAAPNALFHGIDSQANQLHFCHDYTTREATKVSLFQKKLSFDFEKWGSYVFQQIRKVDRFQTATPCDASQAKASLVSAEELPHHSPMTNFSRALQQRSPGFSKQITTFFDKI